MDGGEGWDTFTVDNGNEIGGDVAVGGDGYDTVEADASVAATGLHLNLFAAGTQYTPDVNRVPHVSAAIGVEVVKGGAGNDRINATRLGGDAVQVKGLAGDDTVISGGQRIVFDGGENFDTIEYAGAASNYVIALADPEHNPFPETDWLSITNRSTGRIEAAVRQVELAKFADSTTYNFATGNWSPTVRTVVDQTVVQNEWHRVSEWFKATDIDSDVITQYRFKDGGTAASSGYFWTPGNAHYAADTVITVNAADLDSAWFRGGQAAGSDTISVQAFDGKDWNEWKSFNVTTRLNTAPMVAAVDQGVAKNASLAASSLFSASDVDGDAITAYRFWDASASATSGHFVVNGVAQGSNQVIDVSAADLAQTTFQAGTTADDLWVQAFDGFTWSAWKEFHLNPPVNTAPLVAAADQGVAKNASLAASSLFSVSDPDGDAITAYRFRDATTAGSSGHFVVNGVAQGANQTINVSAAQLSQITFQTGTTADGLWVQAYDGQAWSAWKTLRLTPAVNRAPVAAAADQSVAENTSLAASSLFSVSDGDGDAVTAYRFRDATADAASGHFVVNGVAQGVNQTINISAAQLSQTTFQTGTTADNLWVQAYDGQTWSAWKQFNVTSVHPTTGTEGDDVLTGDASANILKGLGGDDTLIGKAGPDVLDGGAGTDTADYSASSAAVSINLANGTGKGGDAEGDTLISIEHAIGSAFNDTFQGGNDRGQFLAGDGEDTMIGGSVYDWFEGGKGNDTFIGTGGFMVMFGGDGNDTMTGSLDIGNYFDGGTGNDVMTGGNTTDYMADVVAGDDIMHGGGGDDTLVDLYGATQLYGEGGKDFVTAAGGSGLLDGGDGNDYITVANGSYTLIGGIGDDTFEFAGTGSASFTGGDGADVFTYRVGGGPMTVTDFQDGIDHIYLWDNHYYGNVPFESLTIADSAAGAVISWNGASEMVLTGIHANQLTQGDFIV
jgi:Ca2+-binding RTX toxin-like protein